MCFMCCMTVIPFAYNVSLLSIGHLREQQTLKWKKEKENLKIWAASWQNQQSGMCAQRRLRSACASAQSDQSLRCPHEETLGPQLPIEHTAKTLIRLGGCPGWSESSLGTHAILLVLSWGGSYAKISCCWYPLVISFHVLLKALVL